MSECSNLLADKTRHRRRRQRRERAIMRPHGTYSKPKDLVIKKGTQRGAVVVASAATLSANVAGEIV